MIYLCSLAKCFTLSMKGEIHIRGCYNHHHHHHLSNNQPKHGNVEPTWLSTSSLLLLLLLFLLLLLLFILRLVRVEVEVVVGGGFLGGPGLCLGGRPGVLQGGGVVGPGGHLVSLCVNQDKLLEGWLLLQLGDRGQRLACAAYNRHSLLNTVIYNNNNNKIYYTAGGIRVACGQSFRFIFSLLHLKNNTGENSERQTTKYCTPQTNYYSFCQFIY